MSATAPSPEYPVRLVPIDIAKPWGREIWYSAIECRGESRVLANAGEMPLSHYLQAVGLPAPIILLKVLDPHPEPVRGDLYFEVHREKRELYVVTAVDRQAWPDGRGQIRLGMNQKLRRRFADDELFRAAYLDAVRDYENIRRQIDNGEPSSKEESARLRPAPEDKTGNNDDQAEYTGEGEAYAVGGGGPYRNGNHDDEAERTGEEARKRAIMDAFTNLRNLVEGDVVAVPTWTPHALQHGVRVVEFQTPSYERYIISFAQKVLTQRGWDSEYAIARLSLDPPPEPEIRTLAPGIESIASFDDFGVWRTSHPVHFPAGLPYALCMAIGGTVGIGALRLGADQACLVPAAALPHHPVTIEGNAQCLIAAPTL